MKVLLLLGFLSASSFGFLCAWFDPAREAPSPASVVERVVAPLDGPTSGEALARSLIHDELITPLSERGMWSPVPRFSRAMLAPRQVIPESVTYQLDEGDRDATVRTGTLTVALDARRSHELAFRLELSTPRVLVLENGEWIAARTWLMPPAQRQLREVFRTDRWMVDVRPRPVPRQADPEEPGQDDWSPSVP